MSNSRIDLDTLSAEDVAIFDAEQLTYLIQLIAGRLIEISQRMAVIEPEFRQLKGEAAYISAAMQAARSALKTHRLALGGE